MNLAAIVKEAVRSLQRTVLRSALTVLGVVVGSAAIIVMVALGRGAQVEIENSFAQLQWDYIVVVARPPIKSWRDGPTPSVPRNRGVTLQDYSALKEEISGVSAITARAYLPAATAGYRQRVAVSRVYGWNSSGFEVSSRKLIRGASFSELDVSKAASVCLVSEALLNSLFPNSVGLGQVLRINGNPFFVIGVVQDDAVLRTPLNPEGDLSVVIPITSLLRRLDPAAPIDIALKTRNDARVTEVIMRIRDLMEQRRGTREARFDVFYQMEGLEQREQGSETMTLLLGSIAGVSLLVGGIGIMNVMLVNVTERTREIGIRLAIGTRDVDILLQFLVEAMILSVAGGVIGVILGMITAKALTYANGWPTEVTVVALLTAFLSSVLTGIASGYFPASKAARLDPIEALRAH